MKRVEFEKWGPYFFFGSDSSHEIRIVWKQTTENINNWFRYGVTEDCNIISSNPQESSISQENPSVPQINSIVLSDLTPSTIYFYKIGRDLEKIYQFRTGPPLSSKEKFNFVIFSDLHATPDRSIRQSFDKIIKKVPDHNFSICLGDIIQDDDETEEYNCFFHDANGFLNRKPFLCAMGNHDGGIPEKYMHYVNNFPYPYDCIEEGAYYFIEYANVVFIVLDTDNAGNFNPAPGDVQYEWLEQCLDKHSKTDKWLFICMHRQIYSTGSSYTSRILHEVLFPLIEEYHVDAVFYGHDHHYEAFWTHRETNEGTLFINVGTYGGPDKIVNKIMSDREGKNKYIWKNRILNVRKDGVPDFGEKVIEKSRNIDLIKDSQLFGALEPTFLHITIEEDIMEIRVYGWDCQILHHINLKKSKQDNKINKISEILVLDHL
jgi:predicted phosphodiesterase